MALSSNKKIFLLLCSLFTAVLSAQTTTSADQEEDYKDRKSHENFRKRRVGVSSWQINQLKEGALVVRLNTNQLLIDGLKKRGLNDDAEKARLQQAAINVNTIRAYQNNYKFGKVYFMPSNFSDSLLNGARSGIFVDSTLNVNPSIRMAEKFYLLAESDYVYNSSIGFVPEDSARKVVERGNPSSAEFPIVVKNKYGHQLKNPFPFATSKTIYPKTTPVVHVNVYGNRLPFEVTNSTNFTGTGAATSKVNGKDVVLTIPRMFTYEAMSMLVSEFNAELTEFYRTSARITDNSKEYQEGKPFFY